MNKNLQYLNAVTFEINTEGDQVTDIVRKVVVEGFAQAESNIIAAFGEHNSHQVASILTGLTVGMVQIAISFGERTDASHEKLRQTFAEAIPITINEWRDVLQMPPLPADVRVDPAEIEKGDRRWHGEDVRVVSVRWEPYKPDGARQMGVKGRWQECVGSGDYWRWNNCERPQGLRAAPTPSTSENSHD